MYQYRKTRFSKHLDFLISDIFAFELSLFLAYMFRFGRNPIAVKAYGYTEISALIVLVNLIVAFFLESYSGILKRDNVNEIKFAFVHRIAVFAVVICYMYFVSIGNLVSRLAIGYAFLMALPICYFFRFALKKVVISRLSQKGKTKYNLAVVTTRGAIDNTVKNIGTLDINIMGACVVDGTDSFSYENYPIFRNFDYFLEFLKNNPIDGVFLDLGSDYVVPENFILRCRAMGIAIHRNIGIIGSNSNQMVNKMGNYTVLTTAIKIASSRQVFLKRCLDVVGGIVGCLLTGILFIFIGPAIYKADPGPIFYSQERVGKNGRKFRIYKFRSMYMDADKRKRGLMAQNEMGDGFMFKMKDDPRILKPIGKFIRDYSLDEFPQFWNVLKGDMSLVGTRPPTVDEYEKYSYHHKARLATKPGITGMWQVSGRSNITNFEDIVELDTEYITNWSLALDIQILIKTVKAVLKKEGAE